MVSRIFEAAAQGAAFAQALEDNFQRSKARSAAIDRFGDIARDPELFQRIQNIQIQQDQNQRAQGQEQRAQGQEQRAQSQEQRAQQTFDARQKAEAEDKARGAALNVINGLRSARDRNEDVGATFDKLSESGVFETLGVTQEDLPIMRQTIVDNPAFLDDLFTSLGGTQPAAGAAKPPRPVTGAAQTVQPVTGTAQTAQSVTGAAQTVQPVTGTAQTAQPTSTNPQLTASIDETFKLLDRLDELGAVRTTEPKNVLDALSRGLRSTALGQSVERFLGTDASSIQSQVTGLRTNLLLSLATDSRLSSRLFDTENEKKLWLQQFGTADMPIQAQIELLKTFRRRFEAGEKITVIDTARITALMDAENANQAQDEGETPEGADSAPKDPETTIYPGFVNPKTGAVFKGGVWNDPANWEPPQ